jgi:radical SAM-linked protein
MSEARQRWRIVFARDERARYLSHLDAVTQWERAFRRGGIPVATTGGFNARPKLVFAAPLELGMLAEHELADLYLAERLPAPDLRARLTAGMPAGYRVVDVHDVWVGAPALAPQLVAADYRMTLFGAERGELASAAAGLLASARLRRERRREAKTIAYDLRPLIIDLQVRDADPGAVAPDGVSAAVAVLWMRLRHSQERGSGRADEVVSALADELGLAAQATPSAGEEGDQASPVEGSAGRESAGPAPTLGPASGSPGLARSTIETVMAVRERLWLDEELDASQSRQRAAAPAATTGG